MQSPRLGILRPVPLPFVGRRWMSSGINNNTRGSSNNNNNVKKKTPPRRRNNAGGYLFVDAMPMIYRGYFANRGAFARTKAGRAMTASESEKMGTVSFLRNLMRLVQRFKPVGVGAVFDVKRSTTFRSDMHDEYKANRPPTPNELVEQVALAMAAVKTMEALNVRLVQVEGFEADDVLATYASVARKQNIDAIIVSPDKDLLQIVDSSTSVRLFNPVKGVFVDERDVENTFGVSEPFLVPHVQSFAGDGSDNIPGVPNVGIKSAAAVVNAYGGYEEALESVDVDGLSKTSLNKKRIRLIKEHAENVRLSYQLAKLRTDVAVPKDLLCAPIGSIACPSSDDKYGSFLEDHGFDSLHRIYEECIS